MNAIIYNKFSTCKVDEKMEVECEASLLIEDVSTKNYNYKDKNMKINAKRDDKENKKKDKQID